MTRDGHPDYPFFCLFLSGVLAFSSNSSCAIPYRLDAGCVFFISPGFPLFQVIVLKLDAVPLELKHITVI